MQHDIPYELWNGKTASVKYFKVFGSPSYIKRDEDNLGKFDPRIDEGIILGYSSKSKAYKCFKKRLHNIVENTNVRVHEMSNTCEKLQGCDDSLQNVEAESVDQQPSSSMQAGTASSNADNTPEIGQNEAIETHPDVEAANNQFGTADTSIGYTPSHDQNKTTSRVSLKTSSKFVQKNHPINQILQENRPRATRRNVNYYEDEDISLLSMIEPKSFEEVAEDKSWVVAMEEELDQIQKMELRYLSQGLKIRM